MKNNKHNNRIDFLASEKHYAEHAKAIYDALPAKHRGVFRNSFDSLLNSDSEYVAVFSYADLKKASTLNKPIIFGEHGVGMFYNESNPSYAGSTEYRENVVLRLSPNAIHATKEKEVFDNETTIEIIGVPKMDKYAKYRKSNYADISANRIKQLTVAISFHWDCFVCPETRSAFKHFKNVIRELGKEFKVIGHGHPRIIDSLRQTYNDADIEIVEDWDVVMQTADIYICDNSSTLFEFAFLNKPVVLLNSPHYRKNIEHSGNVRFWKHSQIGPQVDEPDELIDSVYSAWENYKTFAPLLNAASKEVFTYLDGQCSKRAVDAIIKTINK